jgi:hypothetical protein
VANETVFLWNSSLEEDNFSFHCPGTGRGRGQERVLSQGYREAADLVGAWPRTARLLRALAERCEAEAVSEDRRR